MKKEKDLGGQELKAVQFGKDRSMAHFVEIFSEMKKYEEDLVQLNQIYDKVITDHKLYLDDLQNQDKYEFLQNKTFRSIIAFLLDTEWC